MSGTRGGLDALLQRPRPTQFQQFIKEPSVYLASQLYRWRRVVRVEPIKPITVVCLSDTHNSQPSDIPTGEILIHAGDITQAGTLKEIQTSIDWLNSLPHPNKVLIAGNHDIILDHSRRTPDSNDALINWGDVVYLNASSTVLSCDNGRELKIYGCPLTPRHGNWAFQYPRDQDVWESKIPDDTDILITHGPPKGHLDAGHLGCKYLLDELWRRKPRLHVFGHIHDGYGMEWIQFDQLQSAYENIVIAGGGVWGLVWVIIGFVAAYLTPAKESRALLVNPAMVGGLRDEQRRRPIVAYV